MSIAALIWVFNHAPTKDATEQIVLLAIADHCDDDGTGAFPSLATLSRKTRLNRRSVIRVLGRLTARGIVSVSPGTGRRASNHYTLPIRDWCPTVTSTSDPQSPALVTYGHQGSDPESPALVTHGHQGSDPRSPDPSFNLPVIRENARARTANNPQVEENFTAPVQDERAAQCPSPSSDHPDDRGSGTADRRGPTLIRRRNLSAMFEGPIFDIPKSWAEKVIRESNGALTVEDVDRFGLDLTAACEREGRGVEPGKLLSWLDRSIATWMASRADEVRGQHAANRLQGFFDRIDRSATTAATGAAALRAGRDEARRARGGQA